MTSKVMKLSSTEQVVSSEIVTLEQFRHLCSNYLEEYFTSVYGERTPDHSEDPDWESLERLFETGNLLIKVVKVDEVVVGFYSLLSSRDLFNTKLQRATVLNLFITKSSRSFKLIKQVTEEIEDLLRPLGVNFVDFSAPCLGDPKIQKLYRRFGYREEEIKFVKRLN